MTSRPFSAPPRAALRAPPAGPRADVVACKEELGRRRKSRTCRSRGNSAVSTAQLKSVLATAESARLPWGSKEYFTREEFEADLKRIVAFYRDRGYPDARVRSFDARLSDDQKSVRLKIDIEEGEPIRVERVVLTGLEPLPDEHRRELETRLPLKAGAAARPRAAAGQPRGDDRRAQGPRISDTRRGGRRDAGIVRSAARRHLHRATRAAWPTSAGSRSQGTAERRRADRSPPADVQARPALPAEQAAREPAPALLDGALQLRQRRGRSPRCDVAKASAETQRRRGRRRPDRRRG